MDIEDKIRELRTSISQTQAKKARAAVELENSKERLAEARRILSDEYGVVTTEQAKAKLAELSADLDDAVKSIENALNEAGA